MDLVIDRNVWLRGETADDSFLLRPDDGKMCCVGIYLKQLGVKDVDLEGVRSAEGIIRCTLPDEARWLLKGPGSPSSHAACQLYEANDELLMIDGDDLNEAHRTFAFDTPADREAYITDAFAEQGVTVTFIN